MTNSGSFVFVSGGGTQAKLQASLGLTAIRQNPSLRSTFVHMNGAVVFVVVAMVCTKRGMTLPSSCMAWCGASDLSEASLTAGMGEPRVRRLKERSRIMRKARDLCGIAAIGLTLRFGGQAF